MLSLDRTWEFRFDVDRDWRPISIPGCWDVLDGVAKNVSGPAWYRKRVGIPREFAGKRIWIHFDAVSYHAVVNVNGREIGRRTGAWDAFTFEITDFVSRGRRS